MADITGSIGSSLKTPITLMVLLIVGTLLTSSIIVPAIVDVSTETNTIITDGAQWIRMDYVEDNSDYTFTIQKTNNNKISVINGTNTQTGSMQDMILYADDLCTLVMADGDMVLICEDGTQGAENTTSVVFLEGTVRIERMNGAVSVYDGSTLVYEDGLNQWAYVPMNTGAYGSIDASGLPIPKGSSNVAAYGSFAGIYCYNGLISRDVGLVLDSQVTSDTIEYVKWIKDSQDVVTEEQEAKKEPIVLDPINPGKDGNNTKAVPTPTYTDGDWGYELNGSDATIVSYSGAGGGVLTIPATVGGYNVVAIGKGGTGENVIPTTLVFTKLEISQGITYIKPYAFNGCYGLRGALEIPSGVTIIGQSAFQNCSGFNALTIPNTVTTIKQAAFSGCTGFRGSLVIPNSVTTIESRAFQSCEFNGTLTLPNAINSIGSGAFSGCKFSGTLEIPNSVTNIGSSAFGNCTGFTGSLVIPDSVTSIGGSAFHGCTGITGTLTLPNTITDIDSATFSNCNGFTGSLLIPDSVTSIGSGAFQNCSGFDTLVIPDSVRYIDQNGFRGCTNLEGTLTIPATMEYIGINAFSDTGYRALVLAGNTTIHDTAFADTNIKEVLDLGNNGATVTSYGLNAEEVRTEIDAECYMAIAERTETITHTGAVYTMLAVIPLIIVASLVFVATHFIRRQE